MSGWRTVLKHLNTWPTGWWTKRIVLLVVVFIPTFIVEACIRPASPVIRYVLALGCTLQIGGTLWQFSKQEKGK